jgi:hypothetical protein
MKNQQDDKFVFDIALTVLNSLGRNLYRNFITILGEAISNSWDADANNVKIQIDKEKANMTIFDDGIGMSVDDFRNKFLLIGYSKRDDGLKSPKGRPYIGRKGIGKLALLSCAERVTIITKKGGEPVTGGTINNADLDKAIDNNKKHSEYTLDPLTDNDKALIADVESGTIIRFSCLKKGITRTLGYIRKIVALYFRFSLIDKDFTISINGSKISLNDIEDLIKNSQFLWTINKNPEDSLIQDPLIEALSEQTSQSSDLTTRPTIRGFIASVNKPKDLKILGVDEKISVDLFVNGRLRERDILKHIQSARIPESYLYGQIHYDLLDNDSVDRFTSSREGVIADDALFGKMLKNLQSIIKIILDEWDNWRIERNQDGDDENDRLSLKTRTSKKLYRQISGNYVPDLPRNSRIVKNVKEWINELEKDATFNLQAYIECFMSENLIRKYIIHKKIDISSEKKEINKWRNKEKKEMAKANLSINIRSDNNGLFYLNMESLAKKADPQIGDPNHLANDGQTFMPIRNAVMHTSRLTSEAQRRLISVYENITARIKKLLT